MQTLPKTSPRCKCGKFPPLRATRAEALLAHLGPGETVVAWNFYTGLRATVGWSRATADQALNDAVVLGKARLSCDGSWIVVEVFDEENSCLAM